MIKCISDLITMHHNIIALVGGDRGSHCCEIFASCVDANDCKTRDMREGNVTFACAREIMSFSNEHLLAETLVIS